MKLILLCISVLLSVNMYAQNLMADFEIPQEACENQGITFTDLSTSNNTITNWNWNFGDGSTSTLQHPTHSYLAAGDYVITLTVYDDFGLSDQINKPIKIHEETFVEFTLPEIPMCSNDEYVDLNEYVNITGGVFSTELPIDIEDGILDVSQLNIGSYPWTDYVDYNYVNVEGCGSWASSSLIIYEAPSATLAVTNTSCGNSDGEIAADVISPNGAYISYWNTGDQNTTTVSGLSPGTYYYNIIDDMGCKNVSTANVSASDFHITGNLTNPSCHNGNDGAITLSVTGGSGNISTLWSTGHSSMNLSDLAAGNYEVVLTDSDGCQITKTFDLQNPDPFEIDYYVTQPDCGLENGVIDQFTSLGGTAPYIFNWSNGETTTTLNGIPQGNYGVVVQDDNGCEASEEFNLVPWSSPSAWANNITNATCGEENGKIDIGISPAFGEQITGIQWSNGESTEDITNLAPGTYWCTLIQSDGCYSVYKWEVKTSKPPKPEICIVSVDSLTNTNLLVWEKEENNPYGISHYNIYRETANVGQYQLIDTVNHSSISVFNDVVASPAVRSWRYRISAVNNCQVESNRSIEHKTIHLTMNDLGTGEMKVSWDNYEGFIYNTYDLLRYTDEDGWNPVQTNIPFASTPSLTDTTPSLNGLNYMIEVASPGGTCTATYGKAQDYNSSRSNKPSTAFNPGEGTGDPNNSLAKFENENFVVALYPNPSNGQFEVALNHYIPNASLSLEVIDMQGKSVYTDRIKNGVNYIQLNDIQSGMYFVKVMDDTNMETIRIVVQ